jgi:alpha 1,3-glucosidase
MLGSTLQVMAVKREDFKTCTQSGFCRRHRSWANLIDLHSPAPLWTRYKINSESIQALQNQGKWQAIVSKAQSLSDQVRESHWIFILQVITDGMIRLTLKPTPDSETSPQPIWLDFSSEVLMGDLNQQPWTGERIDEHSTTLNLDKGSHVRINYDPLTVELYRENKLMLAFNGRGYLRMENGKESIVGTQFKDPAGLETQVETDLNTTDSDRSEWLKVNEDGIGPETFKDKTDNKSYGTCICHN